ncbi:MAG: methylmalonyl Co-A mutase-associated GTPase MeaB [Dehalococcoidia bacterium]
MINRPSAGLQVDPLLDELRGGKPLAIARAITAIENGTPLGTEVARATRPFAGRSWTLGVTGPPGAGKSSLINALIAEFATRRRKIGVLTVDPSSPLSGGALLGDRVRMAKHSSNPQVFIRSLAARGHLGGVTRMTAEIMGVLDAAGVDLTIVETVGTGQSEVDVADLVRVKLVVCPPGLGDDMQAIKAGVLEIADLLVVNKADLPGAEQTAMQLRAMLHHGGSGDRRSVMLTDAVAGSGVSELADAIEQRFRQPPASDPRRRDRRTSRARRSLASRAASWVRDGVLDSLDPRIEQICLEIEAEGTPRRDALRRVLSTLLDGEDGGLMPGPTPLGRGGTDHEP